MAPSRTHLVLIPSYNSGPLLHDTVLAAQTAWAPVWVVVDGSTDGSADRLPAEVRVLRSARNQGKGAAVRRGAEAALADGFTHALVMDADGQHPAECIAGFMACSAANPAAMVLGQPQFGADAPWPRVQGRRLSNLCTALEAPGAGIGDSLFGFRVYPLGPLLDVLHAAPGLRGFDFDPGAVVRLAWAGVPAIGLPAPVRYPARVQGGVSHFRYVRDNLLLARMHVRLLLGSIGRGRRG